MAVYLVGAAWDFDARRSVVNETLSPSSCNRRQYHRIIPFGSSKGEIAKRIPPRVEGSQPNAFQPLRGGMLTESVWRCVRSLVVLHPFDVGYGSWLRENAKIEFTNGNFVSTSINLKNRSAGDGCRDKTIEKTNSAEKTILRAFRARTFSRSQGQSRRFGRRQTTSGLPR